MGSGAREYVNDFERAVNVALRYVGLVDTANWVRTRKVRDTEWHEFTASGKWTENSTEGLSGRNAQAIKKAFPRCKVIEHGTGPAAEMNGAEPDDDFWFVRFKMNEQTLSKL